MLNFHVLIEKEGNIYSSLCLELNVASQGKSISEAVKNIKEAVDLYIEDVVESGDEKDFIPRPAPPEEWIKYFEVESRSLKTKLLKSKEKKWNLNELVYG